MQFNRHWVFCWLTFRFMLVLTYLPETSIWHGNVMMFVLFPQNNKTVLNITLGLMHKEHTFFFKFMSMCVFVLYQCCLSLCRRWSSSRSLCPGLPTGSWSETNTHKVKEKCIPLRRILNLTSFFELEFIKYWCMKVYRNRKKYVTSKGCFALRKKCLLTGCFLGIQWKS